MRVAQFRFRIAAVAAALTCMTAGARAQQPTVLHVTAEDSTGAPIPAAELTVVEGLNDVIAHGTTDEAGHADLAIGLSGDGADVQVVMRKIGYSRGDRFVSVKPHQTLDVDIMVAHPHASLAAVRVTADADLKRKSYFIDADAIANSPRPLFDAFDIVKKLRPDMLTSRGGCPGIQDVWVNGKRVVLPLLPIGMAATHANVDMPANARISYIPITVLSEIAPEHIESMSYKDCWDTSNSLVHGNNALFIVLKPGVEYQQDVGSFVVDQSLDAKPR